MIRDGWKTINVIMLKLQESIKIPAYTAFKTTVSKTKIYTPGGTSRLLLPVLLYDVENVTCLNFQQTQILYNNHYYF